MHDGPVDLLWTGGWDSSYRLLSLLLDLRLPVQPIYLYDDKRVSAPVEVQTMQRLRERLAEEHPHTRELMLPTRIDRVPATRPRDDIEQAFDAAMRTYRIGDQYAFLSRWCRDQGLHDVELSIEWFTHGTSTVLRPFVSPVRSRHGFDTFRLRADAPEQFRLLFGAFTFPLFVTSKPQMRELAVANGWSSVLDETWFCHRPTRDLRPCGFCNPCQYALEQGFGARIPRSRRALSRLYHATLMPLRGRARQILRRFGRRA